MESDTRLGDTACQFCAALNPIGEYFLPMPFWYGFFVFIMGNAALIGGVAARK